MNKCNRHEASHLTLPVFKNSRSKYPPELISSLMLSSTGHLRRMIHNLIGLRKVRTEAY